jgi:hypothetical protein
MTLNQVSGRKHGWSFCLLVWWELTFFFLAMESLRLLIQACWCFVWKLVNLICLQVSLRHRFTWNSPLTPAAVALAPAPLPGTITHRKMLASFRDTPTWGECQVPVARGTWMRNNKVDFNHCPGTGHILLFMYHSVSKGPHIYSFIFLKSKTYQILSWWQK